ncbi:MAG: hypothetical protein ACOX4G_07160 [Limnochordia bacterium]|jgi:hypothetical protein
MGTEARFWRWLKRLCLAGASLAWVVLFYRNYWDAAVPAYGDITIHLAGLRQLFWRYVGAGIVLGGMWWLAIRQASRRLASPEQERVRQRSN